MAHVRWLTLTFLIGLVPTPVTAQVFTDPDRADADFAVQGEYVGHLKGVAGTDDQPLGVQVIALGKGRFRAVLMPGGLPGEGWNPKRASSSAESQTAGDRLHFEFETMALDLAQPSNADRYFDAHSKEGVHLGKLSRVDRRSKTLGLAPPDNATVLFDGSTAQEFVSARDSHPVEMTDDGLLMQGVKSVKTFQDGHLHIEFRLPFKPAATGQARGNSGIYMQGRYEVQMLDSFGLSGEHNECGGIYSVKKPDINMCFPPLCWQTYDIDFVAARFDDEGNKIADARMTVFHNGVKIHDEVKIPKATTAAPLKESSEPGYLYLQDHGNPVRYRNIWYVEKSD